MRIQSQDPRAGLVIHNLLQGVLLQVNLAESFFSLASDANMSSLWDCE